MNIAKQLRPHYESPLEWWYMHGRFGLNEKSEYNFIFTIFRNQFKEKNGEKKEGYQFILAIQNKDSDDRWERTYIDPVFFEEIIKRQSWAAKANIEVMPVEHYLSTSEKEGPPLPIILTETSPELIDSLFRLTWENIKLEIAGGHLKFSFCDDSKGLDLSISSKINPLINIYWDNPGSTDKYGMSYLVQPRIELCGTFNDQEIIGGDAWFDHQWGNYEWLYEKGEQGKIKGWNWLGINLDDGTDIIIWQQREAETGTITDSLAVLIREERIFSFNDMNINQMEEWFSYRTDCYFPLRARIEIPELSAQLLLHLPNSCIQAH